MESWSTMGLLELLDGTGTGNALGVTEYTGRTAVTR